MNNGFNGLSSGLNGGGMNGFGGGGKKSSGFVMLIIIVIITIVFNVGSIAKGGNKSSKHKEKEVVEKVEKKEEPKKVDKKEEPTKTTESTKEKVVAPDVVDNDNSETTKETKEKESSGDKNNLMMTNSVLDNSMIAEYNGTDKNVAVNGGFADMDIDAMFGNNSFQSGWTNLSELDELNRVGVATAFITPDSLRVDETQSNIQKFKPTGWNNNKIDNKNVYSRTHLIGYGLTKDNMDVKENLMTGTQFFDTNSDWGLKHYENLVIDSVKKGNSVLYEVRPIFSGNDFVAKGVQVRAISYGSQDLDFNVFIYNVQDNFTINYKDGSIKK